MLLGPLNITLAAFICTCKLVLVRNVIIAYQLCYSDQPSVV